MRPDPRDRSAFFSLLPRSLAPGLRLPRPASFLSLPRLAARPLTAVLTPLVTLSSLDGALQLLVLLIADPALTLAALVILGIAVAHVALSGLIIQLIALPALATLVVLLVVLLTTLHPLIVLAATRHALTILLILLIALLTPLLIALLTPLGTLLLAPSLTHEESPVCGELLESCSASS